MTMTNKKTSTTNPEETLKKLFSGGKPSAKNVEIVPEMSPVANIKVFGVGGGGSNAVNRMIKSNLQHGIKMSCSLNCSKTLATTSI